MKNVDPNRDFLVKSQSWKHQGNVWNLFKLETETSERHHWRRSGVFILNFEQILHITLVFPLLTLNKYLSAGLEKGYYAHNIFQD